MEFLVFWGAIIYSHELYASAFGRGQEDVISNVPYGRLDRSRE